MDFTENDFGVVMRPSIEDGIWDGDIHVSVFSHQMPEIDSITHAELMYLAYKMSAMIQLCNEDPEVDKALTEYTADMIKELNLPDRDFYEDPSKDAPKVEDKVTSVNGNVITLDFNTKCGGNG